MDQLIIKIQHIFSIIILVLLLSVIGMQSSAQTDSTTRNKFSPEIGKGKSFEWEVKNYYYKHIFEEKDRSPSNFINGYLFYDVTDPLIEYHNEYPMEKNGSIYRITITNDIEIVDSSLGTTIDDFNVSLDGTNLDIYGINNPSPGVFLRPKSSRWFYNFITPISIIYPNGTEIKRFDSDLEPTSPDTHKQRMEDFHTTYSEFNGFYPPSIYYLGFSIHDSVFTYNLTRLGCPFDLTFESENNCSNISKYNETIFTSLAIWDRDTGVKIKSHEIYRSYRETKDHGIYFIEYELELISITNSDLNLLSAKVVYFVVPTLILFNFVRKRKTKIK